MKIFTVKFKGYYPVGACALVVAKDKREALKRFNEVWDDRAGHPADPEITEFVPQGGKVQILLDGNY